VHTDFKIRGNIGFGCIGWISPLTQSITTEYAGGLHVIAVFYKFRVYDYSYGTRRSSKQYTISSKTIPPIRFCQTYSSKIFWHLNCENGARC